MIIGRLGRQVLDTYKFGDPYRHPCPDGPTPPAGTWPAQGPQPYVSGLWANSPLPSQTRMVNVTTGVDCHGNPLTVAGSGMLLQPRPADQRFWPTCTDPESNCNCPGSDVNPPIDCVGAWPIPKPVGSTDPTQINGCSGDDISVGGNSRGGNNCYRAASAAPLTVDYLSCKKQGFKNVQAKKSWHGMFAFNSHDPVGRADFGEPTFTQNYSVGDPCGMIVTSGSPGCGCGPFEVEQTGADNTKYLTASGTATIKIGSSNLDAGDGGATPPDPSTYTTDIATFGLTVDRTTGIVTKDNCSLSGSNPGQYGSADALAAWASATADTALGLLGQAMDDNSGIDSAWQVTGSNGCTTWNMTEWCTWYHQTGGTDDDPVMSCDIKARNIINCTISAGGSHFDSVYGGVTEEGTWDPALGRMSFDCSATQINYHVNAHSDCDIGGVPIGWFSVDVQINLTNQYLGTDAVSHVYGLLSYWDMADDKLYPWRPFFNITDGGYSVDGFLTVAPLVCYNEVPYPVRPIDYIESLFQGDDGYGHRACTPDWVDPNAAYYNSDVLGAPLPAGYESYYDYRHVTWRCCLGDNDNQNWYVYSYGAWAGKNGAGDRSDAVVPPNATQWTNNYDASFLWPGAWVAYGMMYGSQSGPASNQIWAQKWAETKVPTSSYNFARPCGSDRYTPDADTVQCCTKTSDSPLEVTLAGRIDTSHPIVTGDFVNVVGVAGASGIWQCTVIPATLPSTQDILRLDTQIAANAIPFYITDVPGDTGSGYVGKICWTALDGATKILVPAICGRVAITGLTNDYPAVITLSTTSNEANYLNPGDKIYVDSCVGNIAANGGTWTLLAQVSTTEQDVIKFTLQGCNATTSGMYAGGGYAYRYDYPFRPYYFDDSTPKGDFLIASWNYDFRGVGERNRNIAQYATYQYYATNGPGWSPAPNCGCWVGGTPSADDTWNKGQAAWGMPPEVSSYTTTAGCGGWKVCGPDVISFSPNTTDVYPKDIFAHSQHSDMGSFQPDERYGSLWQGAVFQQLDDPLWQSPAGPCKAVTTPTWQEKTFSLAAGGGGYTNGVALQTLGGTGSPVTFTGQVAASNGSIGSVTINSGGYDYKVGDLIPISETFPTATNPGTGGIIKVTEINSDPSALPPTTGYVSNTQVINGGTNYAVDDYVAFKNAATVEFTVTYVTPDGVNPGNSGAGAIAGVSINTPGTGYVVGQVINNFTPNSVIEGGAAIKITTIDAGGGVTGVAITAGGHGYVVGEVISTLTTGGSNAVFVVATVGGPITSLTLIDRGSFSAPPRSPAWLVPTSPSDHGYGATVNLTYNLVPPGGDTGGDEGDDPTSDNSTCLWREDDGSCSGPTTQTNEDGTETCISYYPARPYIEARNSVPTFITDAVPTYTLPSGVAFNFLTCYYMNTHSPSHENAVSGGEYPASGENPASGETTTATGNILLPPAQPGVVCDAGSSAPGTYSTAWETRQKEVNCVCAPGTFASIYKNEGILCDHRT